MFGKITTILDNYLAVIGYSELTTRIEEDFGYYYYENVIAYSLIVSERFQKLFTNFCFENGLQYDCGIFVLAFFHELGHHVTMDLIPIEKENECEEIKKGLTFCEEDCLTYFALEDEMAATRWAISFINENIKSVKTLARKIKKAIDKLDIREYN